MYVDKQRNMAVALGERDVKADVNAKNRWAGQLQRSLNPNPDGWGLIGLPNLWMAWSKNIFIYFIHTSPKVLQFYLVKGFLFCIEAPQAVG
jgi:hypothetical protein